MTEAVNLSAVKTSKGSDTSLRIEAMDLAIRWAQEHNTQPSAPAVVAAAETFLAFMQGEEVKDGGTSAGTVYVDVVPRLGKAFEYFMRGGNEKS